MSVCTHINKLKVEKIANLANNLKKFDFCQSNIHSNKNSNVKQSSDIWICLDCGNQACSKYSESACAQKHSVEQKHRLAIGVKKLLIFCFECDNDLQSILDELEVDQVSNNNTKKLETFVDKVKQTFFKLQQAASKSNNSSANSSSQQTVKIVDQKQQMNALNQPQKLDKIPNCIFGLQNIGNTCFFNSVIQCLNGTQLIIQHYIDSLEYDFDQQIDVWEEINNEEKEQSTSVQEKQDEDDGWNCVKKKDVKKITVIDNSKYTQIPAKKINQLFKKLLVEARLAKNHIFNPQTMYNAISQQFSRFKTFEQQDAHDLLRCLLDSLIVGEEKWLNVKKNIEKKIGKQKNTITENIFGGYLANYLKCLECNHVSRTFDFSLDLALPIVSKKSQQVQQKKIAAPLDILGIDEEKKENSIKTSTQEQSTKQKEETKQQNDEKAAEKKQIYQLIDNKELSGSKVPYFSQETPQYMWEPLEYTSKIPENNSQIRKLENLLDEFFGFEILNKTNNYYKCEKCGQSQKAMKKFYLYETPQVLTLVLKRFVQTGNNRFEKINYHVEIPEIINVDPYTLIKNSSNQQINEEYTQKFRKNINYELYGTVCHQGSLSQGHYVSYVKHIINGEAHWFYYSDEEYHETNWHNVKGCQAYILFYKKIQSN
ncbi:hypothetical protein ABPG74_007167 [Tetrahymena malaccensis]